MSDTGDGSDDGDDFDKEAEREKLREEYERDQKRREATQQMSDLLLKGATMTNAHCDDCGSPIFRYDGEAFCPTCAGTREMADGEAGDQPGGQAAGAGQGTAGQRNDADPGQRNDADRGQATGGSATADAGGQARSDAGSEVATGPSALDPSGETSAGRGGADRGAEGGTPGPDDLEAARARLDERAGSRAPNVDGATDRRSDPPRSTDSAVRSGEVPSMAQSRASLRRAIVSLSEQAAQSDDPGRAHDLLKGAREAAEALAALEGTTGE